MRTSPLLVAIVATSLTFLGACDSAPDDDRAVRPVEDSSEPVESPSAAVMGIMRAKIVDTDFAPETITIDRGASVRWKQVGDQPHSVTAVDESFDSSPDCGPLDSDQCLGRGATFVHAFEEPGTYRYYCRVHGLPDGTGMTGSVVVR
jgi:plastocyanin